MDRTSKASGQGGVIAFVNLKGGVGKSTAAVNVAAAFAGRGYKVRLVDADPQGTASDWVRRGRAPFMVAHGSAYLEREEDFADGLTVVDTPASLTDVIGAVVDRSDVVVVPVTPSGADLRSTIKTLELIGQTGVTKARSARQTLLLPCRVDRRTAAGRELPSLLAELGVPVAPPIGSRGVFVDAFSAAMPVPQYSPTSQATAELDAVADFLLKVLHGQDPASRTA